MTHASRQKGKRGGVFFFLLPRPRRARTRTETSAPAGTVPTRPPPGAPHHLSWPVRGVGGPAAPVLTQGAAPRVALVGAEGESGMSDRVLAAPPCATAPPGHRLPCWPHHSGPYQRLECFLLHVWGGMEWACGAPPGHRAARGGRGEAHPPSAAAAKRAAARRCVLAPPLTRPSRPHPSSTPPPTRPVTGGPAVQGVSALGSVRGRPLSWTPRGNKKKAHPVPRPSPARVRGPPRGGRGSSLFCRTLPSPPPPPPLLWETMLNLSAVLSRAAAAAAVTAAPAPASSSGDRKRPLEGEYSELGALQGLGLGRR